MLKPKSYRSNGTEAYRLVNEEGGQFLYEGRVDYSDAELFDDGRGKAYYRVTSDIGGTSRYYVEVEAAGNPIPSGGGEKAISGLMRTTPGAQETPEPPTIDSAGAEAPLQARDTCFEAPEKPPAKDGGPGPKPSKGEEAHAAVEAMASLGERRPRKKSSLALVIAVLAVLVVAGAVVTAYALGYLSGIGLPGDIFATPTPTATPTATPTPTPTPTATATPTALPGGNDIYKNLMLVAPIINGSSPSITAFVANNSNQTGTSYGSLAKVCDLFDAVNGRWVDTGDGNTPQNLSLSVSSLKGSPMDYSILMASLVEAAGMEARVVVRYNEQLDSYVYYPEARIATNDADNYDAKAYLRGRYNITDPCIHNDGIIHWLSLGRNSTPGVYEESLYAKTVNSRSEVTGV